MKTLVAIAAMIAVSSTASACISCVQKNIGAVMNEVALHATHLPAKARVHAAPKPGLLRSNAAVADKNLIKATTPKTTKPVARKRSQSTGSTK